MPAKHDNDDARAKAEELVAASPLSRLVSAEKRETVVAAVTEDLRATPDQAAIDEERLVKIETQTRVLAEAVIAITDTSDALAPAVQAVKDEM
jgi:hypothetical protein